MEKNKAEKAKKKFAFSLIKNNLSRILIMFVSFLIMLIIALFDVASSEFVMSFKISEYEVGQIADKTIVAEKNLPSTLENPISIAKGEKITRKGFPITQLDFEKMKKMVETPEYIDFRSYANSILFFFMLLGLSSFMFSEFLLKRKLKISELIFIAVLFVICYGATVFGTKLLFFEESFNIPAVVPSIFCVMFVALLVGKNVAVSFAFLLSIAILNATSFDIASSLVILCTSLISSRIVVKLEKRMDFIWTAMLMALLNVVLSMVFLVIFNSESSVTVSGIFALALNGFVSGVLVLGFLTPFELMMNTATVFRLLDLSDTNTPILQRLLLEASGTYNHSMMVATLVESACREIGANALLARVGAIYHDIGKVEQPEYFTENNSTGENKHIDLNPNLSISIIRQHVKKGVEKATQMRFPREVIDIIAEHHGNDIIHYFYNKAKEQNENVIERDFSYLGNPPSSREAAVVMLADTVEAACHSLENPTSTRIKKFVHQLIFTKLESGQLDKCSLTFKDLATIEKNFVTILTGYYHKRIKYQNQEIEQDESEQK